MPADGPRGAGPAGGLLFLAVILFLAYLVVTAIVGALRWLIGLAFVVVVIGLAVSVVRRR